MVGCSRVFFLLAGFLCVIFGQSYAQTDAEKEYLKSATQQLVRYGQAHADSGKLAAALREFLRAAQIAEQVGDSAKLKEIQLEIGDTYCKGGLFAKGIEVYRTAYPDSLSAPRAALSRIGEAYLNAKSYGRASWYFSELLKLKNRDKLTKQQVDFYQNELLHCYEANGDYSAALAFDKGLLEEARKNGDSTQTALILNNIGFHHQRLNAPEKAITFFKQTEKLEKQYGEPSLSTLLNLGVAYHNLGENRVALDYLLSAANEVKKTKNNAKKAEVYHLLSLIYFYLDDLHNAEHYNKLALKFSKKANLPALSAESLQQAAEIAQANADFESALSHYQQYLNIRDSLLVEERLKQQTLNEQQRFLERTEKELKLLLVGEELKEAELRETRLAREKEAQENEVLRQKQELQAGRLREATLERERTQQRFLLARRQLEAERQAKELGELKQKEELQNALLKQKALEEKEQKNQLKLLESQNEVLEKEKALSDLEFQEQEARERFMYIIGFLGFLVLGVILWGFLLSRRKNRTLAEQKTEILQKNEELESTQAEIQAQKDALASRNVDLQNVYVKITDSINYAQRIQAAILPPYSRLSELAKDAFVFFRPRDVVSGDFYWFVKHEGALLVAAVDCTGHGVPGAFMSMIGNDLLNEIVLHKNHTLPGEVLTLLNRRVMQTLQQDETQNRDGMDMALLAFPPTKDEVWFAGAKNPLLYVKDGEIERIKGDKMPIGGGQYAEAPFTTHRLPYDEKTGFTGYIFSDGYQDQFGGPKGKKFMIKNLRKLLHEVHEKPMQEQHEILEKRFVEWLGREEQIDDVLLVGVQF